MAAKGSKEKRQKISEELNELFGFTGDDKKDFSKMDYEDLADLVMILQNKQKALALMEHVFNKLELAKTTQQELPAAQQQQVEASQQAVQQQAPPVQQAVQGQQQPPAQSFNLAERPFFKVLGQLGFRMEDVGTGENVKRGKRLMDEFSQTTK